MTPTSATVIATAPTERLLVLDVVRGAALMGILVMNLPTFTGGSPSAAELAVPLERFAHQLREFFFFGKFNGIFSLLFGLGFTLQLQRLEARVPDQAARIYSRRLVVLLLMGLVHLVFFYRGDVLHLYALMGFGLLFLRGASSRVLVALIVLCLAGPILSQLAHGVLDKPGSSATVGTPLAAGPWSPSEVRAFGTGSYLDLVRANIADVVHTYDSPRALLSQLGFLAQLVTTMLLGMLVGRQRWLLRVTELMPDIVRLQWGSLGVGIACGLVGLVGSDGARPASASFQHAVVGTAYVLGRLGLMSFYLLTLVRALQSARWQRRLLPLAAAGRMPLTNYLMQTAICSLLFSGWGLGLWDRLGPSAELLVAPAIFFGIQVPFSMWLLGRWEQGPFESLWRRATYRPGSTG